MDKVNIMKVIIKHGTVNYDNKRYFKGDILEVSEHFYNCHISRFEKASTEPTNKQKVVTNDEPTKTKAKEKKSVEASTGKTPNKPKSKKGK